VHHDGRVPEEPDASVLLVCDGFGMEVEEVSHWEWAGYLVGLGSP
jgi:hypothetical protein